MAERSFANEVVKLRLGDGDEFRGDHRCRHRRSEVRGGRIIDAVDAAIQATSALRAAVFALGTALRLMVRVARPRWRIRMPGDAYRRCTPRETAIGLVDIEAGGDEFALATRWERWQPMVATSAIRRATDPQLAHCADRTRPHPVAQSSRKSHRH